MKRTVFVANLQLYNPSKKCSYDYYERRVHVGEDGHGYIKLNGHWERLINYCQNNRVYNFERDYVTLSVQPY